MRVFTPKTGLPDCDVFSIDVEDWFHIMEVKGAPALADWQGLPSRMERSLHILLDLLDDADVKATCFFLAWVAEQFPELVRETARRGHEISSHGYAHDVVHHIDRPRFRHDIRRAKAIIEDTVGTKVLGYRAPGFSITTDTPWAFDEILEAGYIYDCSVFPGHHGHGGLPDHPRTPHLIETDAGTLVEFPMSLIDTPLGSTCFFGGGYLRLFPWMLISHMARKVRREGRGVNWYLHPREVDPGHPRIEMSLPRKFRSYVNLHTTVGKVKRALAGGNFKTYREMTAEMKKAASRVSEPVSG